jgi:methionine-rich copper-binding protein CopC
MGVASRRAWLTVVAALLAAMVVAVAPVHAHSDLSSSDPQDGAVLAEAPQEISFTFNEELLAQGNAVTLTHVDSDTRLELGEVEVRGDTVRVAWPDQSPAGEFRAAYRVVSADGHPIDGAVTFMVEQAMGGTAAVEASPSASPSDAPTASGDVAGTAAPSPLEVSASPQPVAADSEATPGTGLLLWALGLGAVALAGAGLGARYLRRTR